MQPPVLVAMAVYIGKTRLIDNFIYEGWGYKNGLNRRVQTVLRCRQSRPLSRNQDFDLINRCVPAVAKLPLRIPFRRILTAQEGAAGKACFAEQSNELFVSRTLPLNTTQTGFFRHPMRWESFSCLPLYAHPMYQSQSSAAARHYLRLHIPSAFRPLPNSMILSIRFSKACRKYASVTSFLLKFE